MVKMVVLTWVATLGFLAYRLTLPRRAMKLQRAGQTEQAVALRERAVQLRMALAMVLLGTFAVLLTLVLV
jgi:hypothetical protein